MNILIVPTVRKIFKGQFEYSVDIRLLRFLKKTFKNSNLKILTESKFRKIDLIIFCGGNSILNKKVEDLARNKLDNYVFNFGIKKKIKMIGICYGAQFLANKSGLKLGYSKNHVGNHFVKFKFSNKVFKLKTNSFHNNVIIPQNNLMINSFGHSLDGNLEAFHIKKRKILALMWHPERYKNIKRFDKILLRKFYATNNLSRW